jgi:hypothetical protein
MIRCSSLGLLRQIAALLFGFPDTYENSNNIGERKMKKPHTICHIQGNSWSLS